LTRKGDGVFGSPGTFPVRGLRTKPMGVQNCQRFGQREVPSDNAAFQLHTSRYEDLNRPNISIFERQIRNKTNLYDISTWRRAAATHLNRAPPSHHGFVHGHPRQCGASRLLLTKGRHSMLSRARCDHLGASRPIRSTLIAPGPCGAPRILGQRSEGRQQSARIHR